MNESKSYYAIIPANVRYDNDLSPNAKLLYGEITALCNEKGYCWATNDYFAKLYGVSKTSVSKWIALLIKKGYLYSEIEYKDGTKEILHRYLRIVNEPIEKKLNRGIEEKLKDNNTINNNTINNTNNNIYITKDKKSSYGCYGRIKLTDAEYQKLIADYGKEVIDNQIELLDEYVESNNNKNKYTNFNLVLRKSLREKWFNKKEQNNGKDKRYNATFDYDQFISE